jgi:hypothetical protein
LSLFWSSLSLLSSDGLATGLEAQTTADVADNEALKRFSSTRGSAGVARFTRRQTDRREKQIHAVRCKDIFSLSFRTTIDVASAQRVPEKRFDSCATALSASRNPNAASKINLRNR